MDDIKGLQATIAALNETVDEQRADIKQLRAKVDQHAAEVEEFNAGWQAAVDGKPPTEPDDMRWDQWLMGYAWAKWNPEAAEAGGDDEKRRWPGFF